MENTKGKVQGIWKKYWDVNAGLSHPSKSIKRIAKVFYYFYLVAGIVGAAACLISFCSAALRVSHHFFDASTTQGV